MGEGSSAVSGRSKETLGHGAEGVVTPAGLKAWSRRISFFSRRVRAEARGEAESACWAGEGKRCRRCLSSKGGGHSAEWGR